MHERFEVEAGALADQFEFEAVGPARSEVRDRADATSKKLCKLLRTSPENRGAPESQYYETKYVRENPMGAD
ncbi:hypothetical protein [Pseudomonas aeruginosa]|uniref:hypothetical protein n=1 Tax=Pseudomonas aeruginosa TaxID=287 RepID=UPI00193B5DCF|nr:hypothetical protein [Pseudomonas aeruginosa]MBM2762475.1 hypothetical protein [Pseudomonas aeruginosa]